MSGYNLWTDCQLGTLVPPLNSSTNAAPASMQALVLGLALTLLRNNVNPVATKLAIYNVIFIH